MIWSVLAVTVLSIAVLGIVVWCWYWKDPSKYTAYLNRPLTVPSAAVANSKICVIGAGFSGLVCGWTDGRVGRHIRCLLSCDVPVWNVSVCCVGRLCVAVNRVCVVH